MGSELAGRTETWVVKVGSALITDGASGLHRERINHWCEQFADLMGRGVELVLVSSGSIAEGLHRLHWTQRPRDIHRLQAAAAVGQMGLVQTYESALNAHGIKTAQVLLTHEDLSNRTRYLNARGTLTTLVNLHVLPVVNENDTVTTDEIRFGDNDNLAALVANLLEADRLIILTDQQGLYNRNPTQFTDAELLSDADPEDPALMTMAGPSAGGVGVGGMTTKVLAAKRAARGGTQTIIASGRENNVLLRLLNGESIGTRLTPRSAKLDARKRWMANQLMVKGALIVDDGACSRLKEGTTSLLAIGIKTVNGEFYRGELVSCLSESGEEVARGLVNYNAGEIRKIAGCHSRDIEPRLGFVREPEVINRDVMVSMRT
ncbi:MAG: glutamate 5-kinase [Pseudomonadota bacterium]